MTTAENAGATDPDDDAGNGEAHDEEQSTDCSSRKKPDQRSAVVSQKVDADPDDVRAYWTSRRRREARPPEFHRDVREKSGPGPERDHDQDAEDDT